MNTDKNPVSGDAKGQPDLHRHTLSAGMASARRKPKSLMTATEYAELHDALTLASDALGDGASDVDRVALRDCVDNQRIGLRITETRLGRVVM